MPVTRLRKDQLSELEGYKELTYNPDGTLSQVVLYDSDLKVNILWTKVLTYVNGEVTAVGITYSDGSVVTKDLTYDVEGNLIAVQSS